MGYSLFKDIEARGIRAYNRGVVMMNITEDLGGDAVKGYFSRIPEEDRAEALAFYQAESVKRGYLMEQ